MSRHTRDPINHEEKKKIGDWGGGGVDRGVGEKIKEIKVWGGQSGKMGGGGWINYLGAGRQPMKGKQMT